jgi:enoyl-CoA hydratase
MGYKNLELKIENSIAIITIQRPEKLNALNAETITELFQIFKKLKQDETVAVVIITGSGEKAFAAGADILEIQHHDEISGRIFSTRGQKVFRFIEKLEKPVIAAINGFALGGGCELAMSCHIRLASQNVKLGQPEINLGLMPGYGGTQRLPRLIGSTNALFLLLTGESIDAARAASLGLVNEVVPAENLMNRAKEIATILASKAPIARRYILQAVMEGLDKNLDTALNTESELFGNLCATEDMKEGTSAFLEKRKPTFKGK